MTWHRRFFWLLMLFLPTQLGYHFWPDWAMVLGRRVDYLSPTLYLTDILLLLTVLSFARSHFTCPITRQLPVVLAVALFATLNIVFAASRPVAVSKWVKVFELVALGWYIVRTKPPLSALRSPLSIAMLYSSLLAIAQFVLQRSVGGPIWWLGERTFTLDTPGVARIAWYGRELLRPYATFPHPNVLGGYIAALLPLVGASRELGSRRAGQFSLFTLLTIATGAVALALTFSRSAIVTGALALVFVFSPKRKTFFLLATLLLLFSAFLLPFSPVEESVLVRGQLAEAALNVWRTSPLIGVGLGNFLVRLPEALPSRTIYFLQPAHNIYLFLLSEAGVVGLLFFVWVLSKAFRPPLSIWHVSLGALAALGLIDHYVVTLQQGQLLLTLLLAVILR